MEIVNPEIWTLAFLALIIKLRTDKRSGRMSQRVEAKMRIISGLIGSGLGACVFSVVLTRLTSAEDALSPSALVTLGLLAVVTQLLGWLFTKALLVR